MLQVTHIRTKERSAIPSAHTACRVDTPLVLSVPHGGMHVLSEYEHHFMFGRGILVDNDMHTPVIYPHDLGSSLIAHLSPHQVNYNRSWDIVEGRDPLHTDSYLPEDPLYVGTWDSESREKLGRFHADYHTTLERMVYETREQHGYALLIDCHALNSVALANTPDVGNTDRADFIIGTLDDTSASPTLIERFHALLEAESASFGLCVVRNDPYKGGYTTKKFAHSRAGVHVLQLEIKKRMYMYEGLSPEEPHAFELRPEYLETQGILRRVFATLRDESASLLHGTP